MHYITEKKSQGKKEKKQNIILVLFPVEVILLRNLSHLAANLDISQFKKYLCFNKPSSSAETFFNSLEKLLSEGDDLISVLVKAENDFLDLIGGETEEVINYFTNPYNALFKDENGYFAVIKNGKFTDVKRPFSFNPNQMKKIIKEAFDEYANDFSSKFASEKEKNSFLNSLRQTLISQASKTQPYLKKSVC